MASALADSRPTTGRLLAECQPTCWPMYGLMGQWDQILYLYYLIIANKIIDNKVCDLSGIAIHK